MRRIICVTCLLIHLLSSVPAAEEEGLASWYGGKFQGRTTASGEVFDTNLLTAAHKELAFDTLVKVTNLRNEQSVIVRINDRGPFVEGRIIDLSRAAADAIGLVSMGVAPVKVEIVETPPPSSDLYSIQIGAYRQLANAMKVKERVERAGIAVTVKGADDGIHRVSIPEVHESKIEAMREILRQAGFPHCLVKRIYP